jgi:hypothetical protein
MDTLCRNMTIALSICDKTTHSQSAAQVTWSVKEVSKEFSNMFKSVSDGYAHMAPPLTLPQPWTAMTPKITSSRQLLKP